MTVTKSACRGCGAVLEYRGVGRPAVYCDACVPDHFPERQKLNDGDTAEPGAVAVLASADAVPFDFAERISAEVATVEDVSTLNEYRARLAYYESKLARNVEGLDRVRRAQRLVEVRIGELLGPAQRGGDRGNQWTGGKSPTSETPSDLTPNERHQFRQMAENPALVEEALDAGMDSRRAVLTHIKNPALYTSDSDEWYTPLHIVELAIDALGGIDLDPCSNKPTGESPNVPATAHYTRADDGLSKDWTGSVYMNPPYGREISAWVDKLVDEHLAGRTTAAVALLPARTDTGWFLRLRDFPRCFVAGRLKFSAHENAAPFPSMVVYLGDQEDQFVKAFSSVGDCFRRVDP